METKTESVWTVIGGRVELLPKKGVEDAIACTPPKLKAYAPKIFQTESQAIQYVISGHTDEVHRLRGLLEKSMASLAHWENRAKRVGD